MRNVSVFVEVSSPPCDNVSHASFKVSAWCPEYLFIACCPRNLVILASNSCEECQMLQSTLLKSTFLFVMPYQCSRNHLWNFAKCGSPEHQYEPCSTFFFFPFFFGDLYNRIKHLPNIWKYRKTVIQLCTSSVTFCFCSCLASTCVCFVFFTRLKMSSGSWGCSFIKSPVCNSDHLLLNLTVKVSLIWGAFSYHCSIFNLVLIMVFLEMCITCSSLNLGYHSVLILM